MENKHSKTGKQQCRFQNRTVRKERNKMQTSLPFNCEQDFFISKINSFHIVFRRKYVLYNWKESLKFKNDLGRGWFPTAHKSLICTAELLYLDKS